MTALDIAARVLFGIVAAAIIGLGVAVLVRLLWNWLMPPIFGLPAITYWQALGLFVLSHLLLKGGHMGGGGRFGRRGRLPRGGAGKD
jgi:hypothetical protein